MGKERNQQFYDKVYTRRKYSRRNRSIYRQVFLRIDAPSHILDVGCGDGMFAARCMKHGHQYTGIDFSSVAITNAKILVPSAKFFVVDIQHDHRFITDGDYDIITFLEFLEHVNDDLSIVASIPDHKRVFFSVPNFWHKSHVRKFDDADAIHERYGSLMTIEEILPLRKRKRNTKFLVAAVT